VPAEELAQLVALPRVVVHHQHMGRGVGHRAAVRSVHASIAGILPVALVANMAVSVSMYRAPRRRSATLGAGQDRRRA
jgi:hypothetical protein